MRKVLLYSIMPEHVLNLLKGNKTIEIRKRDLPQWVKEALAQGEVVEGYGYCTKGGKRLAYEKQPKHPYYMLSNSDGPNSGNGKVVVKFEVSGSEILDVSYSMWTNAPLKNEDIIKKSCLTSEQIEKYSWDGGTYKDLYAHHFTNITPIEPMELGDFASDIPKNKCDEAYLNFYLFSSRLRKAPQSFQSAWVREVVE